MENEIKRGDAVLIDRDGRSGLAVVLDVSLFCEVGVMGHPDRELLPAAEMRKYLGPLFADRPMGDLHLEEVTPGKRVRHLDVYWFEGDDMRGPGTILAVEGYAAEVEFDLYPESKEWFPIWELLDTPQTEKNAVFRVGDHVRYWEAPPASAPGVVVAIDEDREDVVRILKADGRIVVRRFLDLVRA